MRNAMSAAAGLAVFFGTACGSSGTTSASSTGEGATSGGVAGTTGTGGSGATTGSPGAGTTGTTTGSPLLTDGTACTANALCQSGVCGLDGTGNCCTTTCKTDTATCAATGCQDNSVDGGAGACLYPAAGGACNSSCQYGMFTAYSCDGAGACGASAPVACPNQLACNAGGTACAGTCDPANGTADCALGWYCNAGTCTPQVQLGACTSNSECQSNVCGVTGTGHCCTQSACTNVNSATNPCGTLDCDGATGACTFPPTSTVCDTGAISCISGQDTQQNPNTSCDGFGTCVAPVQTDCSPYACETGGCVASCTTIADCAKDFYCDTANSVCIPQNAVGPCTENDACLSFQCGANGSGNCCFSACGSTDPSCGISDCDSTDGTCVYPGASTTCGTVKESCSAGVQQNPGVCDGLGNCPAPGTTECTPFICGATACDTSCTSNAQCAAGAKCAISAGICCPALLAGASLNIDSSVGSDSAACCGQTGYTPCQTIGFAMSLIDTAQAANVTLNLTVGGPGNGGSWSGETWPVKLGWGVELNGAGVDFYGPNYYNNYNDYSFQPYPGLFDVTQYSANDTIGYASITGSAVNGPIQIGYDPSNNYGTEDQDNAYEVQVEKNQHLYLSNATLSSSADLYSYQTSYGAAAIVIAPGGHLTLGQDQSATSLGTVTIGSQQNQYQDFGSIGILCQSDYQSLGCTIDDSKYLDGGTSLVLSGMVWQDIDAEDFANINLAAYPQIGPTPTSLGGGFWQCPFREDGVYNSQPTANTPTNGGSAGIWLNGYVNMSITNGMISCLDTDAFHLNTSPSGKGNPTLTLNGTTIQHTYAGVYAQAGSVTATNTTIQYNYDGVVQDTDNTNPVSIDLSGGGNTLACSSYVESTQSAGDYGYYIYACQQYGDDCSYESDPGASAVNLSTYDLNADNVAWDTKGPDLFSCTDSTLSDCTCENTSCAVAPDSDQMSAVYVSSGAIDTSGATVSPLTCASSQICGDEFCFGSSSFCCDYVYDPGDYFCVPPSERSEECSN